MRKCVAFLTLVSVLLLSLVERVPFDVTASASPRTIRVPQDYRTIQEAVDAAISGDTISVAAGTYTEHLIIGKRLTLLGESRATTIISGLGLEPWYWQAPPWWGLVTIVSTNNVTISGFTIQDWDVGPREGIGMVIRSSNFCNVSNNSFKNLDNAVRVVENSEKNLFSGNFFLNSGSILFESSFNALENNQLINSSLYVDFFHNPFQNIDTSNTIDGKPIYYWVNQHDRQIPSNAGYVALVNSTRITIKDINVDYTLVLIDTTDSMVQNVSTTLRFLQGFRFYLLRSYNNTLRSCTIRNAGEGLHLEDSYNNTIVGNTISYNSNDGIALYSSYENIIVNNTVTIDWKYSNSFLISGGSRNWVYHNNIIHRYGRRLFLPLSGHNYWDNGVEGNFWSDYNGTDTDGDGIGSTPYIIDTLNKDNYPLMSLWLGAPDTVAPVANAGDNKIAAEYDFVEFNGKDSYDNVGIESYEWNFGDGTNGTGSTIGHIYNRTYFTITKYTVTLTVKDAKGNSNSISIIVSILKDSNKDGIPDLSDSDNDGMPNAWETEHGLNPHDPTDATGDPDGDLLLNIEEYHLGTDPHVFNISWKNMVFIFAFCLSVAIVTSILFLHKQRTLIKQKKKESLLG